MGNFSIYFAARSTSRTGRGCKASRSRLSLGLSVSVSDTIIPGEGARIPNVTRNLVHVRKLVKSNSDSYDARSVPTQRKQYLASCLRRASMLFEQSFECILRSQCSLDRSLITCMRQAILREKTPRARLSHARDSREGLDSPHLTSPHSSNFRLAYPSTSSFNSSFSDRANTFSGLYIYTHPPRLLARDVMYALSVCMSLPRSFSAS